MMKCKTVLDVLALMSTRKSVQELTKTPTVILSICLVFIFII